MFLFTVQNFSYVDDAHSPTAARTLPYAVALTLQGRGAYLHFFSFNFDFDFALLFLLTRISSSEPSCVQEDKEREAGSYQVEAMWFSTSLLAWALATCALASVHDDTTTDEHGIRSIPLRTHSLAQPYLDSDMQSRWFDFGGNTIVRADRYIRLTSDRPSQEGWLFSRVPLTATNWEIEVEFQINGNGNLHGDGMALWLTKQRATPGPVFGSIDAFDGLGIFFDTYKNNRPGTVFPYVMAMVGDGKKTYDKSNDGKDNEFMGCSARGIRGTATSTKARLTYFQDKSLKLELQYKTDGVWELCFETKEPPMIPSVAYLGFSAETGELSDNHDIISWKEATSFLPVSPEPMGGGLATSNACHSDIRGNSSNTVSKLIPTVGKRGNTTDMQRVSLTAGRVAFPRTPKHSLDPSAILFDIT
ncbi:hypothetical protein WAI453_012784 [Rhynchosporium graminicola]